MHCFFIAFHISEFMYKPDIKTPIMPLLHYDVRREWFKTSSWPVFGFTRKLRFVLKTKPPPRNDKFSRPVLNLKLDLAQSISRGHDLIQSTVWQMPQETR